MDEPGKASTSDTAETQRDDDEPTTRDDGQNNAGDRPNAAVSATAEADVDTPLLPSDRAAELEQRWQEIQIGFVDQPRRAVEQADALVGELLEQLTASFAESRSQLEARWDQGEEASTEDLRIAFTRYRTFFKRLLST